MERVKIMMFFTIIGIIAVILFILWGISWLLDDQGGFTGLECIIVFASIYWKWTVSLIVIGAFILGYLIK